MKLSVDIARHIFCIIVIFRHMASHSRYSPETGEWLASINHMIEGGIVGFFLLAGLMLKRQANLPQYIKHQLIRLMAPFFLFSLIYAIAYGAVGKAELADGLIKTLTLQGSSMQLYSLPYICGLTILYASIDKAFKLRLPANAMLALALAACTLLIETKSATGSDYKLIPFYALTLVLGVILRNLYDSTTHFFKYNLTVAFVVFLIFMLSLADHRFLVLGRVSLIFLAIQNISRHLPDRRLPGTGAVYLLHTPILNALISIFLIQIAITERWNIVATVLLTYLTCLGIYHLVDRNFGRFRWLLLGPTEPNSSVSMAAPTQMATEVVGALRPGHERKRA